MKITSAATISASSHPNARRMYNRTKHRNATAIIAKPTVTAETMKIARLWPTNGRVYSILTSRQRGARLVNRLETQEAGSRRALYAFVRAKARLKRGW